MRQVPTKKFRYLLIGNGRVARHFAHYFSLLNISFSRWHRQDAPEALSALAGQSEKILLAIPDRAIETFVLENELTDKICIHFSGCFSTKVAQGAHPLMTFAENLYEEEFYRRIPFVCEDGVDFSGLFPDLPNPFHAIDPAKKPLYHSLCVMSGNFSVLLWQKLFAEFENQLNLPRETALPYLEAVFLNLLENPGGALTGPLVRRDMTTIDRNLQALKADPFLSVYRGFLETYDIDSNQGRPQ